MSNNLYEFLAENGASQEYLDDTDPDFLAADVYKCPNCNANNLDVEGLIHHFQTEHQNNKQGVCPICVQYDR